MVRPCKCRRVCYNPQADYFKPRGVPISQLEEVVLTIDEFEAIRLADLEDLYQVDAAKKMNISRQTFGNIVESAHRKIGDAIVNAKALKIEGGFVKIIQRQFKCSDCNQEWGEASGTGRPAQCPKCQSKNINRVVQNKGFERTGIPGRR
jgi:uncharacterized protein